MSVYQGKKYARLQFTLLGMLLLSTAVHGAPSLSPADRDTIQQQQRELLEQNQQQRQELQRSLTPKLSLPSDASSATGGPCFTINAIRLEGAEHLPVGAQRQLTQPYLRQCLNLGQIQSLVQQVSDWYISRGYITSRAFLTEQDLSRGELRLLVLEGKLESILLERRDDRMLKMAFPGLPGQILNLRDIEQGMEQINRLRRQPIQIEILPGSQPGYSVVNLSTQPEFPLTMGLGSTIAARKALAQARSTAR